VEHDLILGGGGCPASFPREGITNPFCKESASQTPKSGKIDDFNIAVSDSPSTAWKFFKDD
jgi:hypothetical protein